MSDDEQTRPEEDQDDESVVRLGRQAAGRARR